MLFLFRGVLRGAGRIASHRHLILASCLVYVVCLTLTACHVSSGSDTGITVDWAITPDPPQVGPATITLIPKDSTGAPIAGAELQLEGNMSHPGMQPVFAEATEASSGVYTAPLDFSMAGDWIILVEGTLPDGRSFHEQFDVRGVQAP